MRTMHKKLLLVVAACCVGAVGYADWTLVNINNSTFRTDTTGVSGDPTVQSCDPDPFTVAGVGGDIWGNNYSTTYVYDDADKLSGNFEVTVQIKSFGHPTNDDDIVGEWARAGFLVCNNTDANSAMAFMGTTSRGLNDNPPNYNKRRFVFSTRPNTGNSVGRNDTLDKTLPAWFRMRREGFDFIVDWKQNEGDNWSQIG